ncbi:MAG TPA: biopolymer transporter ExbD [Alphaproteobacteria bacterium]|nr:biopolymer transporter ExbD [Alphaproteobacteria bacterium]
MRFDLPSRPRDFEDSILPLINVIFLLLIFFMLAGTFAVPDALTVEPPRSVSETAAGTGPLVVLVTADGRVALDGEIVDSGTLDALLAARLDDGVELQVKADGAAPARHVLPVLEAAQRAGADRLRLITGAAP